MLIMEKKQFKVFLQGKDHSLPTPSQAMNMSFSYAQCFPKVLAFKIKAKVKVSRDCEGNSRTVLGRTFTEQLQ